MSLKLFATMGPLPPILVLMLVFFAFTNERFHSTDNLLGLSQQSVALLLIALGQMLVLISGGFDLSVGATVALASVASAMIMRDVFGGMEQYQTLAIVQGLGVALLVGVIIGLANGLGVAYLKVNAFITTLATATVLSGITMVVSKGATITGLPPAYVEGFGVGSILGIPNLVLAALPVVVFMFVLLRWTTFGRHVYAVGGNPTAAFTTGISVNRVLVITYIICSMLAAFAAFTLTARSGSGQPTFGANFALQSITAAVIGGTSLRGGRGGVIGTILGVVFIAVLANGMNFMRLDSNIQNIALGLALVLAVLADRARVSARKMLIVERVATA